MSSLFKLSVPHIVRTLFETKSPVTGNTRKNCKRSLPAWPGYTIPNPGNVSAGVNTVGSVLYFLGKGCSLGLFVDWTRLRWNPQAGPSARVDTLLRCWRRNKQGFKWRHRGKFADHEYCTANSSLPPLAPTQNQARRATGPIEKKLAPDPNGGNCPQPDGKKR